MINETIIAEPRKPWGGTMTPRERFNRQMHFQSVDRCFNMEFGYWEENYKLWDIFTNNNIENEEDANRFFAFDPFHCVWGDTWLSPPFEKKVVETRGDMLILQDENGLLAEVPADSHSTIPHYLSASITSPDDWKKVKEERFDPNSPSRKIDIEKVKKEYPSNRDYPLGIFCGSMIGKIRDMLTFEGLCYAWADYPDMLEDMIESCCVLVERQLDQVLGHIDFDYASGWEDICFNHGPILPPSFFADVIAPRYKRISKRLHAHGIDIWFTDCDGDVRPLLPVFLDSGINCLFPYEVKSCVHPGKVLDEYRDQGLRIMGGVDKMQLIAGKEEIRTYLESLIPYVERGGYIPFCDHRCPPDVTPENYLYYLDLKEKLFGNK